MTSSRSRLLAKHKMTGSQNISEFSKKMSSSNQTLLTVVRSSVIHSDLKTYLQVELIRSENAKTSAGRET